MGKALAMTIAFSVGCGTILNGSTATVTPPPGATINGVAGPATLSSSGTHHVVYANGQHCTIESSVGAGYVIVDVLFLPLLIPIIVDAATGNWKSLDENSCPGVMID